jgi:N utilization substance protein A
MKKFDLDTIRIITLFESVTRTNVKDCFSLNETLVFIVKEGQVSKAVGKGGVNVKKISNMLNKRIKIVEHKSEPVKFIKGFISPIVAEEITVEDGIMTIKVTSTKDKGLLIGRDRKNLNVLNDLVSKYFELKEVKIA